MSNDSIFLSHHKSKAVRKYIVIIYIIMSGLSYIAFHVSLAIIMEFIQVGTKVLLATKIEKTCILVKIHCILVISVA